MSCKCQNLKCGKQFKVDLDIPNDLWEKIKPVGKPKGAGLLCGSCIMERIENLGEYDYWNLVKLDNLIEISEEFEDRLLETIKNTIYELYSN